jgi:hypothetical protein
VGIIARGDLILVLYGADARLERTRWIFDRVDELLVRAKGPFIALIVVTENAGPPDAPTRAENLKRFKRVEESLRRIVTVATGDDFKASIVRAIMRGMLLMVGKSSRHQIVRTVDEGVAEVLSAAGPRTPDRQQMGADVTELFEAVRGSRQVASRPALRA